MLNIFKNMFHHEESYEKRKARAVAQDKAVREQMTQKHWDKEVQSTMAGSDPVSRY